MPQCREAQRIEEQSDISIREEENRGPGELRGPEQVHLSSKRDDVVVYQEHWESRGRSISDGSMYHSSEGTLT